MKLTRKAIFTLLFTAGLILILFLSRKTEISKSTDTEEALSAIINKKIVPLKSKIPIPSKDQNEETWTTWFNNQAEEIGHLTEDPLAIQKQLQETAESLPKDRIDWLRKLAKNEKINTDQRLLAIEYLSLNSNVETLDALEDIALAAIDENLSPALKNEANILKAAAIEGLASKEIYKEKSIAKLNTIATKTDDKFLLDRVHRSLWHLKGAAEKPETQDTNALKELIGGSTK